MPAKPTDPATDVAAALTIAKGYGNRAVGVAAGHPPSPAATVAGMILRKRLVNRGELRREFERQGFTIPKFVRLIRLAMIGMRKMVAYDRDGGVHSYKTPDWRNRLEAAKMYAELCGLTGLPLEAISDDDFDQLTDEELAAAALSDAANVQAATAGQKSPLRALPAKPVEVDTQGAGGHPAPLDQETNGIPARLPPP